MLPDEYEGWCGGDWDIPGFVWIALGIHSDWRGAIVKPHVRG